MRLEIKATTSQEVRILQIQDPNSLTVSIFPEIEHWLREKSDHQKAFDYISAKKKMDKYRCIIDFIFCETFEHFKPHCQTYYRQGGVRLLDLSTKEQRERFLQTMLCFLQLSYDAWCEARKASWTKIRDEALSRAA